MAQDKTVHCMPYLSFQTKVKNIIKRLELKFYLRYSTNTIIKDNINFIDILCNKI